MSGIYIYEEISCNFFPSLFCMFMDKFIIYYEMFDQFLKKKETNVTVETHAARCVSTRFLFVSSSSLLFFPFVSRSASLFMRIQLICLLLLSFCAVFLLHFVSYNQRRHPQSSIREKLVLLCIYVCLKRKHFN